MVLVSIVFARALLTKLTMASRYEVVLSSMEARVSRTIKLGAGGVVATVLSRARLRHADRMMSSHSQNFAVCSWSMSRFSEIAVVAVASRHFHGDDANVAALADTLKPSQASSEFAVHIPVLESDFGVFLVRLFNVGALLPVSLGWIDGAGQLGGRVKDLMTIFDSEPVDSSERLSKLLPLVIGGDRKAFDHVGKLCVGQWRIVDDSAIC